MKPKTDSRNALDITQAGPDGTAPSPEHRRFRSLLARIEQARQRLQAWREELPRFAQLHIEHVKPIERRVDAARRAWAFELEQLVLRERFSRAEQATIRRMITAVCASFLTANGADSDPELKALHDRHADQGFDELQALALQALRDRIEAATDLDLGDGPVASLEELMAQAREQQAQAEQAAERAAEEAWARQPPRRRKTTAAERREQAEAAQATQSVREVYRKLAAVLHPDRIAPDATASERATRTAQMAQANAAYEAGDLLALLTLQLQVEQVDVARAGQLAAPQVRQFNRVLAEQLQEIEMDIIEREHTFCRTYGIEPRQRPDPQKLARFLKEDAERLLALEADLRDQRRTLLGEPRAAKRLLKYIATDMRLMDRYDDIGF